jgi:hypothetical protein
MVDVLDLWRPVARPVSWGRSEGWRTDGSDRLACPACSVHNRVDDARCSNCDGSLAGAEREAFRGRASVASCPPGEEKR